MASTSPRLNQRVRELLDEIDRDIEDGKNADGPFTLDEALMYLDEL